MTNVYSPEIIRLDAVQPEQVQWLWPGRIPIGKLSLLVGDPNVGKSLLSLDMAARLSSGTPWPDSPSEPNPRGSALLLSVEDDLGDTVRPRLDAAKADVRRITAMTGCTEQAGDGSIDRFMWNLSRVEVLEEAIGQTPECKLVVIDPVSGFLDGTDSHKNADVRSLLAPLADLAARRRVAVVCIHHMNKNAATSAMYRASGSLAFTAAARAAWLVCRDKADPLRRLLLPIKNNLAADGAGLAFRLLSDGDGPPVIAWEPDPVSISADDALAMIGGQDHAERDEAADWLRDVLADGPVKTKDLQRLARDAGHAWATVRRAKDTLGLRTRKTGFRDGAAWEWSLPVDDRRCSPSPRHNKVSAFDDNEHLRVFDPKNGVEDGPETTEGAQGAEDAQLIETGAGEHLREESDRAGLLYLASRCENPSLKAALMRGVDACPAGGGP